MYTPSFNQIVHVAVVLLEGSAFLCICFVCFICAVCVLCGADHSSLPHYPLSALDMSMGQGSQFDATISEIAQKTNSRVLDLVRGAVFVWLFEA